MVTINPGIFHNDLESAVVNLIIGGECLYLFLWHSIIKTNQNHQINRSTDQQITLGLLAILAKISEH